MRTFIGSARYAAAALAAASAFAASTAFAQVSVQTGINASVRSGDDRSAVEASTGAETDASARASSTDAEGSRRIEARVNGEAMSQLHATTTAREHADENSALMATGTASTTESADEGRPVLVSAKFLGLFPVHLAAHVKADADGNAKVSYPWYAFLFSLGGALDASAQ